MLIGILIIGVVILISVGGLIVVRRMVPLSFLETHHEVGGFFIGVLGVIYAVLLAFVVVVVWEEFEDAKLMVALEANQIGDLSRMANIFPSAVESRIREALVTYTRVVIDEEWAKMVHGENSQRAWEALTNLWDIYRKIEPQTSQERTFYEQSIERLIDLSNSRRLRLHAARDKVPMIMWILLWGGAITTIAFTYFFGVKSIRSQLLMTAALTTVIAFILFLIVSLNKPFAGDIRVTSEAIVEELGRIQAASSE